MNTPKARAPARITVTALVVWWPTDPPTTQWAGISHSRLPNFSPDMIASRRLKVFTWSPFARGYGRSRLPPGGRVLVLRARVPRGNPVLPDLGIHLRLVEPLAAGVGRRLRGDHRPTGVRHRRHAPLSEVGTFQDGRHSPPFDTGGGGLKGHSA